LAILGDEHAPPDLRKMIGTLDYCVAQVNLQLGGYLKSFDIDKADGDEDNFYMEREWRSLEPIRFSLDDILRIIIPSSFAIRLRRDVPDYYGQVSFAD
jgi:hypothetical protein